MGLTTERPPSPSVAETDDESPAVPAARTGYRPHLDGIRAIAVYLVVAFHAGSDRFDGGFIGVDVFFVLSGYLVTRLLLRDLEDGGSIGYRRFYSRRVRRLLPAAVVVLVATAAIYPSIATRADLATAADGIKAAALYVANWFFIRQSSDYFAANVQNNPVLHFWSLSIEEQFYLAWPLLLGGMFAVARRFGRRSSHVVRIIVVGALLLSLANALRLANINEGRAYFGTDTRAYQLLAGALLALTPALFERVPKTQTLQRLVSLAGVGALVALLVASTSTVSVGPVTRGVIATVITVALITSMELGPGIVRSALSWKPIVYLGRISYSIYLWHWLIILIAIHAFDPNPAALFVIAAVLASGLASLSFQVLEHPVRVSRTLALHPRAVVAVGLSASVLVGIVVAPRLLDRQPSRSVSAEPTGVVNGAGRIPADFDWQSAQNEKAAFVYPDCRANEVEKCTLVHGKGKHILLMGDSNARMLIPMLTKVAQDRSLTLSVAVASGCPWQEGILRSPGPDDELGATPLQQLTSECRTHHDEWYNTIIPTLDPDIVIGVNQPWDDPANTRGIQDAESGPVDVDTPAFDDVVRRRTAESIQKFVDDGRKVVMIEPVPLAADSQDPLKCLSQATYFEECRFVANAKPTVVEQTYRDLANANPANVFSVNMDRDVCPYMPICDPIVNGLIARWDTGHLTTRFATTLAPAFEKDLDDNGLL